MQSKIKYCGIVIDKSVEEQDGWPTIWLELVHANIRREDEPQYIPERIYNDEVTRPDAEFCFHRAVRWSQESWPTACAWKRLGWKIKGWRITLLTTI